MGLIWLIILCLIVGAGLYLLQLAPIDATVKQVIKVVAILVLIIYALLFLASLLGVGTGLPAMRLR